MSLQGVARRGTARPGVAGLGEARPGEARLGEPWEFVPGVFCSPDQLSKVHPITQRNNKTALRQPDDWLFRVRSIDPWSILAVFTNCSDSEGSACFQLKNGLVRVDIR